MTDNKKEKKTKTKHDNRIESALFFMISVLLYLSIALYVL